MFLIDNNSHVAKRVSNDQKLKMKINENFKCFKLIVEGAQLVNFTKCDRSVADLGNTLYGKPWNATVGASNCDTIY